MRLLEIAQILRSKNAGPFQLTVDVFFPDMEAYNRVVASQALSADRVAKLYRVDPATVRIFQFSRVLAIKITLDRPGPSSGSPADRDVYGAQQHVPLLDLEIA